MNKFKMIAVAVGAAVLFSGCANTCCIPVRESVAVVPVQTSFQPKRVLAVGYGAVGGSNSQYTMGQQKLMAMRAAQVDAYRNLAEQVYGFRVWGNTAVSAFSTQNDSIRSYVDSFIRGARVVNTTPIADGNFEVTVELDLTPNFFSCVSNVTTCGIPLAVQREPSCLSTGCVQPSGYYYTNQ